ncbi:UNVERIFIED_CONTAM: hypothetical protein NCL1_36742 [Trichonephila clavipes]
MNDLYYFNDFPFPYLESIVLYYKKPSWNHIFEPNKPKESLLDLLYRLQWTTLTMTPLSMTKPGLTAITNRYLLDYDICANIFFPYLSHSALERIFIPDMWKPYSKRPLVAMASSSCKDVNS